MRGRRASSNRALGKVEQALYVGPILHLPPPAPQPASRAPLPSRGPVWRWPSASAEGVDGYSGDRVPTSPAGQLTQYETFLRLQNGQLKTYLSMKYWVSRWEWSAVIVTESCDPRDYRPQEHVSPAAASDCRALSCLKAGDRTRTGDPQLGKLMLYQLSYARDGRPRRPKISDGRKRSPTASSRARSCIPTPASPHRT